MRAGFRAPIAVRRTGGYDAAGRAIWELTEPLFFWSPAWRSWLMVPKGFRTNYASVPRLPFVFWWYGDKVYEEPALHDFVYTAHAIHRVTLDEAGEVATSERVAITRKQGDDLFLEALLANDKTADGMDHTMYRGVRLGGGSSWDDDTSVPQREEIRAIYEPLPA